MEHLLHQDPSNTFLMAAQNKAQQELTEMKIKKAEGDVIRTLARCFQLDGRMKKEFFLSTKQAKSNPPIKQLIDNKGQEYNTNNGILKFTTNYYQQLFSTQEETSECLQARAQCWEAIPRVATEGMNRKLTVDITKNKLLLVLKSLPIGRALGEDGLPSEFFVALWNTTGDDMLEVCKETMQTGTLHPSLNTSLVCLIPKRGSKTNLNNYRPITLLGTVYKIIAKTLTMRLQPFLHSLIRPNQTGFIK